MQLPSTVIFAVWFLTPFSPLLLQVLLVPSLNQEEATDDPFVFPQTTSRLSRAGLLLSHQRWVPGKHRRQTSARPRNAYGGRSETTNSFQRVRSADTLGESEGQIQATDN